MPTCSVSTFRLRPVGWLPPRVPQSAAPILRSLLVQMSLLPYIPQICRDIASASYPSGPPLVVSIAAGVTLDARALQTELPAPWRVVRVMPNAPSLVGVGASAFATGAQVTDADAAMVSATLAAVGLALQVPESNLDAVRVAGVSGSGPAYVYQFIEALSDGGATACLCNQSAPTVAPTVAQVRCGLTRAIATQLAVVAHSCTTATSRMRCRRRPLKAPRRWCFVRASIQGYSRIRSGPGLHLVTLKLCPR